MAQIEPTEFEEAESESARAHWIALLLGSALIVAWGLVIYALVKDAPRQWDFGTLPESPAESVYTSAPAPQTASPPRQIPPLPEAQPWKRPGVAEPPVPPREEGGR